MSESKRAAKKSPLRKKLLRLKTNLTRHLNKLKKKLSKKVNLPKLPKVNFKLALTNSLTILMSLMALTFVSIKAPELHRAYLRAKVGSRVYRIKAELNGGGGTGFQVKAPSGTSYIMTNSHVCDYINKADSPENKGTVIALDDEGTWVRRRIVAISDQTDLCIIEGMPGVDGLSLGSEPNIGDHVMAVGHPHLRPTTMSGGDIIGIEDVQILDYVMEVKDNPLAQLMIPTEDGKCNLPKNQIYTMNIPDQMGGGSIKLCLVITKDAYSTDAIIYPGSSGSPVVDDMGRVVGVMFASSSEDNYGDAVSLDDIQTFIAKY